MCIRDRNSFDQEGVQLGKLLAKKVLAHETDGALKELSDMLNICLLYTSRCVEETGSRQGKWSKDSGIRK